MFHNNKQLCSMDARTVLSISTTDAMHWNVDMPSKHNCWWRLWNQTLSTFSQWRSRGVYGRPNWCSRNRNRASLRRCRAQLETISVGPDSQSTSTKVYRIGRGAQLGAIGQIGLRLALSRNTFPSENCHPCKRCCSPPPHSATAFSRGVGLV